MSLALETLSQWLLVWTLLLIALRLLYPLLRPALERLHPADGAVVRLALYVLPWALSGLLVWAVNGGAGGLWVQPHCHGDECQPHRPDIIYPLVLLVAALSAWGALAIYTLWRSWQAHRKARHLLMLARREGDWWVLPISAPLVFTLGFWRCRLFVSQGLLSELSPQAMDVVAAHEHAHRYRADNLRTFLATLALLPLLPFCLGLREDLKLGHEKACDLAACQRADATFVAQTIVDVTRLQQPAPQGLDASFFARCHTRARVQALLAPIPATGGRTIALAFMGFCALVLFTLGVDSLHHGLEWLW